MCTWWEARGAGLAQVLAVMPPPPPIFPGSRPQKGAVRVVGAGMYVCCVCERGMVEAVLMYTLHDVHAAVLISCLRYIQRCGPASNVVSAVTILFIGNFLVTGHRITYLQVSECES